MFMNDLNTTDTPPKAVSPLKHDYDGRFSRKGQPTDEKKWKNPTIIESILIVLYLTFLLSTDFILFAGSGNIEIFHDSVIPIPEVLYTLLGFFIFFAVYIFIIHKYSIIKYGTAALFSFGFIYVLFKQFSQIRQLVAIGDVMLPQYLIIGFVIAAVVFIIFSGDEIIYKILLTVAAGVLFVHVYTAYIEQPQQHEFIESHNTVQPSKKTGWRFIYFMFPNLVSPTYLSTIPSPESVQTQQIIHGFYKGNGFMIYPKAYTPENGYLGNMILSLNPSSNSDSKTHILNTRLLSAYWRFYNLRNEYIYLKDNELYDIFSQHDFQISAYKSRDFDMCHKNHEFNVNRCMEKINKPTNIYGMSMSTSSKINILLVEWLSSMHIFQNLSSVYNALTSFVNLDKIPMVGVDYNNLYVVNSTKTFDILLKNIKEDSGRQAYFVFADIPSDMYIYDEFCQLKPKDKWLDMTSLPWINSDYSAERQSAYLQQTRCLYGKLQQFMEKMKENNLLQNTIIFIQGTSGVNNFQNKYSNDFIQNFVGNRLVTMAVYDNKHQGEDNSFCSTGNILSDYLYHTEKCKEKKDFGVHEKLQNNLHDLLDNLLSRIQWDEGAFFKKWYNKWKKVNSDDEPQLSQTNDFEVDQGDSDIDSGE